MGFTVDLNFAPARRRLARSYNIRQQQQTIWWLSQDIPWETNAHPEGSAKSANAEGELLAQRKGATKD